MFLIDIRGELKTEAILILKKAREQEGHIQDDGNGQNDDGPVARGDDGSGRFPKTMIESKGNEALKLVIKWSKIQENARTK